MQNRKNNEKLTWTAVDWFCCWLVLLPAPVLWSWIDYWETYSSQPIQQASVKLTAPCPEPQVNQSCSRSCSRSSSALSIFLPLVFCPPFSRLNPEVLYQGWRWPPSSLRPPLLQLSTPPGMHISLDIFCLVPALRKCFILFLFMKCYVPFYIIQIFHIYL